MKQMRSRFRFLTLLLICGFLLTLALCTANLLKTAGIPLPRLPSPGVSPVPSPVATEAGETGVPASPGPEETLPPETVSPGTDNLTQTEYNLYGL